MERYPTPTPDMLAALQAYADRNGRNWKRALSDAWMTGRDEREPEAAMLRTVRNQLGPSWLYGRCKIKPAAKAAPAKRVTIEQIFSGKRWL